MCSPSLPPRHCPVLPGGREPTSEDGNGKRGRGKEFAGRGRGSAGRVRKNHLRAESLRMRSWERAEEVWAGVGLGCGGGGGAKWEEGWEEDEMPVYRRKHTNSFYWRF